jgi:hypothetical protein
LYLGKSGMALSEVRETVIRFRIQAAVPVHQTTWPRTTERCNFEFVSVVVNPESKHDVVSEECCI